MSTIKSSTTTTTAYQVVADTTGTLVIQTGSTPTTAVTVDASQNVGIGTSSPTSKLSVANGSSGGFEVNPDGTGSGPALIGYNRNTSAYLQMTSNALFHVWQTSGTERMRIDSSGNLLVGTTTQATGALLTVNGSIKGTITSGTAVASTSGTSITFTGIPSWVKRITVMFNATSTTGSSDYTIQLGTSGGFITSGYRGSAQRGTGANSDSNGFNVTAGIASTTVMNGSVAVCLLDSANNIWAQSGVLGHSDGSAVAQSGGSVTLTGTLTQIRVTTIAGTDTFDAGSINILYEG